MQFCLYITVAYRTRKKPNLMTGKNVTICPASCIFNMFKDNMKFHSIMARRGQLFISIFSNSYKYFCIADFFYPEVMGTFFEYGKAEEDGLHLSYAVPRYGRPLTPTSPTATRLYGKTGGEFY